MRESPAAESRASRATVPLLLLVLALPARGTGADEGFTNSLGMRVSVSMRAPALKAKKGQGLSDCWTYAPSAYS